MKRIAIGLCLGALSACATYTPANEASSPNGESSANAESTIKGLRYIMVSVSDIDETLDFYGGAVGLEVTQRYRLEGDQIDSNLLTQSTDEIDVALVKLTNTYLKLVDFIPDDKTRGTPRAISGPGYTHMCFKSPATDPAFAKFEIAGLEPISRGGGPVDLFGAGTEYFYGTDTDGTMIEIEIDQRPRREDAYWIGHVANVTPDIDRMVEFYETLLGYPVRRRGALSNNPRADDIADIDDLKMQGAWFATNNIELEFWQFENPQTPARAAPAKLDPIGYSAI
ncbi:MAG: VOC family protein, partial [Pseudomonadota bacterium]